MTANLMTRTPDLNIRRAWACLGVLLAAALFGVVPASQPAASAGPLVSVIVRGVPGADAAVVQDVNAVGGRVTEQLGLIDAVAASVPRAMLRVLSHSPGVAQVTPNSSVQLLSSTYDPTTDIGSAYNTTQLTGAQAMWRAGYTGKGVDVALIDSGVSPVQGLSDPNKLVNGPDLSMDTSAPNLRYLDEYGHGTFMAGIIAGRDVAGTPASYVGNSDNFNGIAPDARVLNVKVADSSGLTDVSQVIAAISWVVQHRHDNGMNVRVLNLSFATDSSQSEILDPMSFAAEHAWKSGIVVVASAGNAGWKSGGLVNPAYNPYLIAVGASDPRGTITTADDTIAAFSNAGGGGRNPDLAAPGKSMQSLRVPGSYIDENYGSTGTINKRFFRGSGTSESAAVTSGAVALLLQQRPGLTPDQVKAILTGSATPLAGQPASLQGNGELNLAAARSTATPLLAAQPWVPATGLGSVEGARGTVHLTMDGIPLNTNVDIFGKPMGSDLINAILNDVAWSGGTFNGTTWSGTTWSGTTWSGTTWSGTTWSGTTWSGTTWSSNTWNGTTWSGTTWSGTTWSGTTWSGTTWSGTTWS
ncbi:MAG TPA: S8 family serine peptidase [Candidatus Dormibacteraeota bacterium]